MTAPQSRRSLRVALLTGTLDQGGSEKQFVYMARALQEAGVQVRTYSLTPDGVLAAQLRNLDLAPTWVGRHAAPPWRVLSFAAALRRFRPTSSSRSTLTRTSTLQRRLCCTGGYRSGRSEVMSNTKLR